MKTEHSPGEWTLVKCQMPTANGSVLGFTVHAKLPGNMGQSDPIAIVSSVNADSTIANAKLIAAAPDLAEFAMSFFLRSLCPGKMKQSALDAFAKQAGEALKKAGM